jgi:phospholipid/cholesterol/gamma-HCH transport system substrate-binding protein
VRDGRAIVKLSIEPSKLPHVYANASAVLTPNTPLKDLQVELAPGGPPSRTLHSGETIEIGRTTAPLDSDDLTAALDADTRQYFSLLIGGADTGLQGRGRDLRALLRSLGPTNDELRLVGDALAARRHEITRLVSNLSVLARAAAGKDRQLAQLVAAGDDTLHALASQDGALRASVAKLPGTLSAARATLSDTTPFARAVGPTLTDLQPAVKRLPRALRDSKPVLDAAEPLLRTQLRPLVRDIQPLAADLAPATHDLLTVTPDLTSAFKVLNYVANELVYEPPGNQGYLFWTAWFAHDSVSMLSTEDPHGTVWRGLGILSCTTIKNAPAFSPFLTALFGPLPVCP